MIVAATPTVRDDALVVYQEAGDLNLIFAKIKNSTDNPLNLRLIGI